jgi:hypothetical protein
MKAEWQQQMDAAFDKYFAMSKMLGADVELLLQDESDTQSSRRNFIRAASTLVEGYTHCFREMCAVGVVTSPASLSEEEVKALTFERKLGSIERTKLTVRATYKLFELPDVPNFGVRGWEQAQRLLDKRDRLMHPKSVQDLEVADDEWNDIHLGVEWLFEQLFGFMEQLARIHGI